MSDTKHRQGEEQQLVYRIDCDKHPTVGGAPLVLILQKESSKPIILILYGTQTYPPRTPIIKDQRKKKGQGYILQDERKPHTSQSIRSAQMKDPSSSTLPNLFANNDPYQHQSMHRQQYPTDPSHGPSSFGQPSYDMSYNNHTMPWSQQQRQVFSGHPSLSGGKRTYPPLHNHPYALSNGDGMAFGRMESAMEVPSPSFYNHHDRMMSQQQPYSPWSQYNQQCTPAMQSDPTYQTPMGAVPPPPPAFRTTNGPRSSKSVPFAPLSDHVVV